MKRLKKVLFVCTGNTCRSPLAEAVFEHKKKDRELQAKSAGIYTFAGAPMSDGAKTVLAKRGIEKEHAASLVNSELVHWADVILTMTGNHKQAIVERHPEMAEKLYTLKEFVYVDEDMKAKLEKIKEKMIQLELKRADMNAQTAGQKDNVDTSKAPEQEALGEELFQQLQSEQEEIERLAQEIPSFDIADPYGGNDHLYEITLTEIEEAVDKLLEKLSD
ncbi:protein-tyrosine phosphatase [Evansella caseinilytica]|uniref:Protein-tyrosine phosphatase n=1 Tax=Evansella caseinilytica TaxID=1503961 RepID=A0A1H3T5F5_9BACI|nr:low molecular weight protein arginine phosphatase [Evansella caseinilytica]SDZ45496.1 protein-tyrosine phosphatase [Evansella caseinilytica]